MMNEEFVGSQKKYKSMRAVRNSTNALIYVILSIMTILWLFPIFWLVLTSFREEAGNYTTYFFPKSLTFNNYYRLLFEVDPILKLNFSRWFLNTLLVAVCSCLITSAFILCVSYVMSRFRFKMRRRLMNLALILGMFPGFMSMIAVYFLFDALGLTETLLALIVAYSFGAGTGFYISKGFFDTVPRALDEAARIDGATRAQIFYKIILPLSKPIIVYTVLTAFMSPWMDFIFVSIIMKDKIDNYTVAIGLYKMLNEKYIYTYFTRFCAGAVLVSIPITGLFIAMQRFYVEGVTGGAVKG